MKFRFLLGGKHKLIVKMRTFGAKMRNPDFYNKITEMRSLPSDFWRSSIYNTFLLRNSLKVQQKRHRI